MKRIFTSVLMLCLCTFLSGQSIVSIYGVVYNLDGSPYPGAFLVLSFEDGNNEQFIETDEEGYFATSIEVEESDAQGCFELALIDCTFEAIIYGDCFSPENYDFNYNFVYCEGGTDQCFSFIYTEPVDSTLVLAVNSFGAAPFTYEWSNGSTSAQIEIPIDDSGEYCVVVTDSQGCVHESCIDLTPPDLCFVHIFEEYNFNSVTLFAEAYGQTDQLTYEWSTGEVGEIIEITESGEYCVTVTDGLGCVSTDCRYIEVDSTWFEDCFSYIYNTFESDTIETLAVESFGVAPFTYVWSFGDEIISTSQSLIPAESGVYCVEVTDAEGCVSSFCYDYFVWEECGVWIGCDPIEGGVFLFAHAYGQEPIEYLWSNGATTQDIVVSENGEYCVTITDVTGCTSTSCVNVNIENVTECFAFIEIEDQGDDSVALTVIPAVEGLFDYSWNTGESTETIVVAESGVYCVEVSGLDPDCFFTTCIDVYLEGQEYCWGYVETESIDDSLAILSVFAIDIENDSLAFEYVWSTGETTETIEVSEEGTYCVTVTGGDECFFEACTDVIFWDFPWQNSIFGIVHDAETGELLDAVIDIYTIEDDGTIELYTEGVTTQEGGIFVVTDLLSGSYIALATAENEGYAPTYSYSTTSWEDATVFVIDDSAEVLGLEIAMVQITNLQGGGTIEGGVSTDNLVANEKQTGDVRGAPLEDANVMLMHNDIHVGQLFTDQEGQYKFTGLPFGTYTVILEIPGQSRKLIEVTLSEDNPNATDIEFESDATSTSTDNISDLSSLTLSPNPTSHTLLVDAYFESSKEVIYRVADMNGRLLMSSSFKATVGENTIRLDVESIESGVYNLILQSDEELIAKRFIKL